jgi:hypothetical protein
VGEKGAVYRGRAGGGLERAPGQYRWGTRPVRVLLGHGLPIGSARLAFTETAVRFVWWAADPTTGDVEMERDSPAVPAGGNKLSSGLPYMGTTNHIYLSPAID